MSDEELIERIRQGDRIAADELIRRYNPLIFRYCLYRCGNKETAEDLTQETFLRLIKYLPKYRNDGRLKTYLFSIANRLCIDENKQNHSSPLENDDQLASPHDELHRIEDRDLIRSLLNDLPPSQREAVILRFGERLTYQEIARETGCTMRTAQGRVKYALEKMRKGFNHE